MDSEIVLMWQQSQGGHPKIVPVEIGPVDLSHWSVGGGGYPVLGVQWLRPRLRERLCHTLRANRPNLVGNRFRVTARPLNSANRLFTARLLVCGWSATDAIDM